mgnify:FL=1
MRLIDAHKLSVDMEEKVFCSNGGTKFVFGYSYAQVHSLPTIDPPAIALPPNDPLTLDELREMDGEPVWIEYIPSPGEETAGFWGLVSADKEDGEVFLLNSLGGSSSYEEALEDIRAIYRRRPKEVTP